MTTRADEAFRYDQANWDERVRVHLGRRGYDLAALTLPLTRFPFPAPRGWPQRI